MSLGVSLSLSLAFGGSGKELSHLAAEITLRFHICYKCQIHVDTQVTHIKYN